MIRRLFAATLAALLFAAVLPAQQYTFGIEVEGVICGYVETRAAPAQEGDEAYTLVNQKIYLHRSLLGNEVKTEIDASFHLDPKTGRCFYQDAEVNSGVTKLTARIFVEGNQARFVYPLENRERTIDLPAGVIIDHPLSSPHLLRDFVELGLEAKTYPVLDVLEGKVQEISYSLVDRETIELADASYDSITLDSFNQATSVKERVWLDIESGMILRRDMPGVRQVYLAKPSIKKQVQMANLDSTIIQPVGVAIPDARAISYMRVRAVLAPTGLRLSPEDLNVPGQSFEGTVTDNRVEGIFTIEHPRYDGSEAPPYPADFSGDKELSEYLASTDFIETEDPVLGKLARNLTAGAQDSWEAAQRLCQWVADNIDYVIPGGMTARKTYDLRGGECGAHSLLTAGLCRAVGIPSRVVWGCVYTPRDGGAFGQHAWNEVYMGEAGWIPIDSTAFEVDYVNSGHLRVGAFESLASAINMQDMEVLEHRLFSEAEADADSLADLAPFTGTYTSPGRPAPLIVLVKGSGLSVDTGGGIMDLHSPDAAGRWYAKLSQRIYFTFDPVGEGQVPVMTSHQILRLQRNKATAELDENLPMSLKPYLGKYRLAQIRADFTLLHSEGGLAYHHPIRDQVVQLKPGEQPGHWVDSDGRQIWFDVDEAGEVSGMFMDVPNRLVRVQAETAQVKSMLSELHRAAAEAAGERYYRLLQPGAIILATDAKERWTDEEFREWSMPFFEEGQGWTTRPVEQHVFLSEDGHVAWFDERLESDKYGQMRGSGVALKSAGQWRIAQYNTTFTVPNASFMDLVKKIRALDLTQPPVDRSAVPTQSESAVMQVLSGFHAAAAEADLEATMGHLAPEAIFFGTDEHERFTTAQLQAFIEPTFARGQGWTTRPTEQHVYLDDKGKLAWFDQRIESSSYGEMRSSGVLVQRDGVWKIVQYNLGLTVPNELVGYLLEIRGRH